MGVGSRCLFFAVVFAVAAVSVHSGFWRVAVGSGGCCSVCGVSFCWVSVSVWA
jgi:hypothetical protein